MINPPPRQLLVVPRPCAQCGRPVREAWLRELLIVGGRRRRRFRRALVHNDPVGAFQLTSARRLMYVGPPAEGLAGHEPNRYSLHRTATCALPENSRHADVPPFAGVTGPGSSAAATRPAAADDDDAPQRSVGAHTARGPSGVVAMQGARVNELQGPLEGAARGRAVGQPPSPALPARWTA